jgi:alkylation response protein AidB-like acyl-CoA dehydrogenase
MQIGYSDDHRAWKEAVEDFCTGVVGPLIATMDLDRAPSAAEWQRLRAGLLGKGIVDEYPLAPDGSADLIAFAILYEAMARVHSAAAAFITEQLYLPRFLRQLLNQEQLRHFAAHVDRPAVIAACFTEPDTGSDTAGISTTARRRADGSWVINGRKTWISRGTRAELAIIYARIVEPGPGSGPEPGPGSGANAGGESSTEPGARPAAENRFGLFLAEVGAGYQAQPIETLGLVAQDLCDVYLDDVVVDDIGRIRGEGRRQIFAAIGPGRASQALLAVGFAQAALDLALPYAKQRRQFGRPIAHFQLVQALLADMAIGVTSSRLMAYHAINAIVDRGPAAARAEVSMAKAYCTETAVRVASLGMEVQGAMGLARETGAERIFRDARMMIVPDGTAQIQRLIIGEQLTGLDGFR